MKAKINLKLKGNIWAIVKYNSDICDNKNNSSYNTDIEGTKKIRIKIQEIKWRNKQKTIVFRMMTEFKNVEHEPKKRSFLLAEQVIQDFNY